MSLTYFIADLHLSADRPDITECLLNFLSRDFMMAATKENLMCLVAGMNVIRFAPSLVIPDEDIKEGLARFERAVAAVVNAE